MAGSLHLPLSSGIKVKICFRLSVLAYGGTERVFLSVANELVNRGHSVEFVVDRMQEHGAELAAREQGFKVWCLNVSRTWNSITPLTEYLDSERPDVIISAYTETNAAALISVARSKHKPLKVVTEHASLTEHWADKGFFRKLALELIVRVGYKAADRIVCVSEGMADQLRQRLNHAHISHIYNPVRFSRSTRTKQQARMILGIDESDEVVIAVGRISRQKNFMMLLRALKLMPERPKLKVYVIGGVHDQSQKRELEDYVRDNGLTSIVCFVDFTHDITAYYESADTLVLSSAWEGFGNVLVEALSFGLQIVSTDCKYGPAEILANGKYGELVDVDDFAAMAKAIERSLDSPPRPRDLLLTRAAHFSEARIGAEYEALLIAGMKVGH